jgi:demethylmenaquinone methyltransferase / 2-methoxy-6-polyprenyl-1,4-benzoquinol methylase
MLPHPPLKSHYENSEAKLEFVKRLFNCGAKYYDFVENWGSFQTGAWYRRNALQRHGLRPGQHLLDVACGTGLVATQAMKILGNAENITCLDPSEGMLAVARKKLAARFLCAYAEQIPLPDDSFEFLTMGYALRHVVNLEEAFREYRRVLAPGGKLLILEITKPARPISGFLFRAYFGHLLPFLALVFTRSRDARDMVQYYWETMDACVLPARVLEAMESSGLREVKCNTRYEVFTEYTAVKP